MTPREPPEWVSSKGNTVIPRRVKERIARRANDCCQQCQRPIMGKLRGEIDHVIPLIIGGEHRETNMQLLCHECHAAKTALDVKLKAKVVSIRAKHLGLVEKRSRLQSRGFAKAPPQHTASRPIRRKLALTGD